MTPALLMPKGAGARRWLLLAAFVLFSWNIWGYDLWAPDEPFFGEGAREMIADGQWLVPHINGEFNNHKPPLFFWLIALFSLPFGEVSSVTARLPSVVAAVTTVAATMAMARRSAEGDVARRVELLSGAMLATSFMFWEKARWSQIDSVLCCLITLALLAFSEFRAGRLSGRLAGVCFWAACALAVLAKGPVGLLLPLGTALLVLAFERSLSRWLAFAPLLGPLTFAGIVGTWLAALAVWPVEGYSVLGSLREHFVDRGISGMHHVQPWWYYAKVLPWASFPWSFLLPGAILCAWRERSSSQVRLALAHVVFVVLFFSVSTEKRELYILPALPAMAFLVARFVEPWLAAEATTGAARHGLSRRWLLLPLGIVGGVMSLLGLAVPLLVHREIPDLLAPALVVGLVFLAGGALVAHAAWRSRPRLAVRITALAMVLALLTVASSYPFANPEKSGRELAHQVEQAVAAVGASEVPVGAFDIVNSIRSINFYTGGLYADEIELGEESRLLDLFASGRPFVLVANRETLPELAPADEARMVRVYATRLSRRDLVVFRVEGR